MPKVIDNENIDDVRLQPRWAITPETAGHRQTAAIPALNPKESSSELSARTSGPDPRARIRWQSA